MDSSTIIDACHCTADKSYYMQVLRLWVDGTGGTIEEAIQWFRAHLSSHVDSDACISEALAIYPDLVWVDKLQCDQDGSLSCFILAFNAMRSRLDDYLKTPGSSYRQHELNEACKHYLQIGLHLCRRAQAKRDVASDFFYNGCCLNMPVLISAALLLGVTVKKATIAQNWEYFQYLLSSHVLLHPMAAKRLRALTSEVDAVAAPKQKVHLGCK